MTESQNTNFYRRLINRVPHSAGAQIVRLQKLKKQVQRTPGRPTHVAASAEKLRKVMGEDRNQSLIVANVPNASTNPDVICKFFAPENQGVTTIHN